MSLFFPMPDIPFLPDGPWVTYFIVFFGPFVQEDVSILTSAAFSVTSKRPLSALFVVCWLGVIASDLWKYFIGRWAVSHPKARGWHSLDRVEYMKDKLSDNLGLTLMSVRFLPLARIPTYAACGYFLVPYWKYCLWIAAAAFAYVAIAFAVFNLLGSMIGEKLTWILPVIVIALLATMAAYVFIKRKTLPGGED